MLLSHCDEHLVGAVQLLSVLHPHDVGLRRSLNGAAEPDGVPLRHRLIGWMLGKRRSCRREARPSNTKKGHGGRPTSTLCLYDPRRKVKGHVLALLHDGHHHGGHSLPGSHLTF